MKKVLFVLFLFVPFSLLNAQTDDNDNEMEATFGINSGIDYNINAYDFQKNEIYNYQYAGKQPQYNIGIGFGLAVTKRFRPRIEMKYVNVKYWINWDQSSYTHFNSSLVNVNYFDITLDADYLLNPKGKFQLYVSPGLRYETETSYTLTTSHWNIMDLQHPSSVLGAKFSLIFKYNISEHWGVVLMPDYTCFFRGFSKDNNKPYQRINTNLGLEFKF